MWSVYIFTLKRRRTKLHIEIKIEIKPDGTHSHCNFIVEYIEFIALLTPVQFGALYS
jgi:hypothetical protein